MKVIVQIPCLNEEETLPLVFEKMPRKIKGVDSLEFQIIDDGCTDRTVDIAKKLGVKHILVSSSPGKNRRWLGRAFKTGLDNALKEGADILVNTDGDNQYPSEMIPELIKPILEGRADIVIGDRQTQNISEFSAFKKFLQKFGSFVTKKMSGTNVPDAVSGFRAYSAKAIRKINIITNYTYTVDTIMQAEKKGLDIEWVKINVNKKTRESRLIKNLWTKVRKSGGTIIRIYTVYEPFRTFSLMAGVFLIVGAVMLGRYGYFYLIGESEGHVQSIIAGGVSFVIAVQLFALGIIADLMSVNRRLTEDVLERIKGK